MSNSLIRAENNIVMIRQVDLSFAFHIWYCLDRAYWLQNTLPLQSYTSKIVATRLRSYVATNLVPRVLMNERIHRATHEYTSFFTPWTEEIALRYTSIFFVMSNRSGYADPQIRTSRIKKQNTTLIVLSEIHFYHNTRIRGYELRGLKNKTLLWSFCHKYYIPLHLSFSHKL